METKIRNIGNALGIILPKDITKSLNLKVDEAIDLNVEDERLVISRKKQSLKENLLLGIRASEEENIEFAESFDELDTEAW
jgi:antitoxin component of MazEF toxin-antitoxin module